MPTWFECKVKYVKVDEDEREGKMSEVYLVDVLPRLSDKETSITMLLL